MQHKNMERWNEPVLLSREACLRNKERLTAFYDSNMKLCSYMDGFSHRDAELKIEGMTEHVSNGTAMVFGMFDGDELIGFVWAYEHFFRTEKRVYVNEIHVDKRYRHRGIGRRLLTAVEDMARRLGYGAIYLHAEGNNEGAIRLYESEGFEKERVQLRKGL